MKITVCSLYINPWYREIVKYGKLTLSNYCDKHGYEFLYETELTPQGVYDGQRDIQWYKIKLILKVLETNNADIVVWNDADSVIVNDEIKMEHFVDKYMEGADILVAREPTTILNTGTMFIRNTDKSRQILNTTWDYYHLLTEELHGFHEQAALGEIYKLNVEGFKSHIKVLDPSLRNEFLSYWFSYYPNSCFILHAARCAHDRAGFVFTMDMFCPIKMDEETDEEYQFRKKWLKTYSMCRADIDLYLKGGSRRNLTARYKKMIGM